MTFLQASEALEERFQQGDVETLTQLWQLWRARLRRLVQLRMDQRVQGRLDPSDILQDTIMEALQRLPEYVNKPNLPPFLWLRFLTCQRLLIAHRRHLGTQMRQVGQEVFLGLPGNELYPSVNALAEQIVDPHSTPSEAARCAEEQRRLQQVLNAMDPPDREILLLRHFEELTNTEVALVLGLSKSAASNRYIRALMRLKTLLEETTGFSDCGGD